MSQIFTLVSRRDKDLSSDEETLTETSRSDDEKINHKSSVENGKGVSATTKEISSPVTEKAARLMGIKTQEIYVRRDVEVESVAGRDERGLVDNRWEGRQERW